MTRKELLMARANDVVEEVLSKDVCISESECQIMREVVLAELMRVEREVWERVAEHCHCMHNDGYTLNDVLGCGNEGDVITGASNDELRAVERWALAQQEELGS